jgi:hypothetical protein
MLKQGECGGLYDDAIRLAQPPVHSGLAGNKK